MSNSNIFRVAGRVVWFAFLVAFSFTLAFPNHAAAQSLIAGDIAGRKACEPDVIVADRQVGLELGDRRIAVREFLLNSQSPRVRPECADRVAGGNQYVGDVIGGARQAALKLRRRWVRAGNRLDDRQPVAQ